MLIHIKTCNFRYNIKVNENTRESINIQNDTYKTRNQFTGNNNTTNNIRINFESLVETDYYDIENTQEFEGKTFFLT